MIMMNKLSILIYVLIVLTSCASSHDPRGLAPALVPDAKPLNVQSRVGSTMYFVLTDDLKPNFSYEVKISYVGSVCDDGGGMRHIEAPLRYYINLVQATPAGEPMREMYDIEKRVIRTDASGAVLVCVMYGA